MIADGISGLASAGGVDKPLESEGSDRVRRRGHLRRKITFDAVRRLPRRRRRRSRPGHVRRRTRTRSSRASSTATSTPSRSRCSLKASPGAVSATRGAVAIDAINDKNDGYFDDPFDPHEAAALDRGVPKLRRQRGAKDRGDASCNSRGLDRPGATSCVKSVTSITNRDFGQPDGPHQPVVLSSCRRHARQRSISHQPRPAQQLLRIVNVALSAVTNYYGWDRIAVVYEVSDSWAQDAARIFSENVNSVVGDRCTSTYCPTEDEAGHDGPKTGIRFDKTTHWSGWHKYCAGESSRTCSSGRPGRQPTAMRRHAPATRRRPTRSSRSWKPTTPRSSMWRCTPATRKFFSSKSRRPA